MDSGPHRVPRPLQPRLRLDFPVVQGDAPWSWQRAHPAEQFLLIGVGGQAAEGLHARVDGHLLVVEQAQSCEMNSQASGGTKALRPSSPFDFPSFTLEGVWAPSKVHTLTG